MRKGVDFFIFTDFEPDAWLLFQAEQRLVAVDHAVEPVGADEVLDFTDLSLVDVD